MYCIGKINRRRPRRQVFDIPLRGKAIDPVRKKIEIALDNAQKLFVVIHIMLPFQNMTQPCQFLFFTLRVLCLTAAGLLVFPVGSNTVFRRTVHLIGTDLYFKRLSVGTDQRRVQRLVIVWFRHGDIIFKTSGNRFIHLMDDPQRRIAFLIGIHDNTDSE